MRPQPSPKPASRVPFLLTALLLAAMLSSALVSADARPGRPYDPVEAARDHSLSEKSLRDSQWQDAIDGFTRAIWLDPRRAESYTQRGAARARIGDLEGAVRDFGVALRLQPGHEGTHLGRAGIRVQRGDLHGAFADARAVLARDPDDLIANGFLLGLYLYEGNIEALQDAIEKLAARLQATSNTVSDALLRSLSGQTATSTPQAATAQVADIAAAQRLIVSRYIDELEYWPLLASAWLGAKAFALQRGVEVPLEIGPFIGANQSASENNVRAAFDALIRISAGKASANEIVAEALAAMAKSLDDNHTAYLRPELWQARSTAGFYSLGYLGVTKAGKLLIRDVLPESPASRAGLRPGDTLTAASQGVLSEFSLASSAVTARVERPGQAGFEVTLSPQTVPFPTITSKLLDGRIGYLRLWRFPPLLNDITSDGSFVLSLDRALRELDSQGARSWILDLRGNPGGDVAAATVVAGRFGLKGQILEQRHRKGVIQKNAAIGGGPVGHDPLVILVDSQSHSAAEVTAASFQSAGRARIMGEQTPGSLNLGAVFPVGRGALEITIARIRVGREGLELDRIGIRPDEAVELSASDLAAGRDAQLEAALKYLRSRNAR